MLRGLAVILASAVAALIIFWPPVCLAGIELSKEDRAYLDRKQTIKICIDPDWMPYEKIKNGRHVGMSADYMSIFSQMIGVPVTLVPTENWSQSLDYAKKRKCDILSLAMPTPERLKYLNFTQAYLDIPLVIATQMDKPFVVSFQELANKELAIIKGYAFVELLHHQYPNLHLIEVENMNDGLKKVAQGRHYGFIGTLSSIAYGLQTQYNSELKINGKFDVDWSLSVAARNDEPPLVEIFNRAVNALDAKQHAQILNSWISVRYDQGVNYDLILRSALGAVFIISLLGSYLFQITKKNRKIKYQNKELKDAGRLLQKANEDLENKNKELQILNNLALDANPITRLPGNNSISNRIDQALLKKEACCVIYCDLDNFKAYNDRYGFARGDKVILFTSQVLQATLHEALITNGFLGHIGGDDFVLVVPSQESCAVSNLIIRHFDKGILEFYCPEDIENGGIEADNRQGGRQKYPIVSISLACVELAQGRYASYLEVNDACADVKKWAKNVPGSFVAFDRRREKESEDPPSTECLTSKDA